MANYSIALGFQPPQVYVGRQFALAADLRKSQLAEQAAALSMRRAQTGFAKEDNRQNALKAYNEARRAGDPNAIEKVADYPDIAANVMKFREGLDAEKQRKFDQNAMTAARDAQRILAIPAGPERDAAFAAELQKDLEAGEISQEDFDRYSKVGADERLLNGIIQQALPLDKLYQQNKPTALMQNLQAAGLQPGTPEYRDAIIKSETKPLVNMPAQEKEYDKELGKSLAKEMVESQKSGANAQRDLANLEVMQQALSDPNLYTGSGGQAVQGLKKAAQTLFGVSVKGVASGELAQNLANEIAVNNKDKLPGPMSNADREFLVDMAPTISKSPEGNRLILELGMAHKRWEAAKAQVAREYTRTHGGRLDAGYYAAVEEVNQAAAQEFGGFLDQLRALGEEAPRSPTTGTGLGDPFGLRAEMQKDPGEAP